MTNSHANATPAPGRFMITRMLNTNASRRWMLHVMVVGWKNSINTTINQLQFGKMTTEFST